MKERKKYQREREVRNRDIHGGERGSRGMTKKYDSER